MFGHIEFKLCTLMNKQVRIWLLTGLSLNLSRQTGHDPGLLGLLRVFKNYYPEIIVGEATRGKASPFKVSRQFRLLFLKEMLNQSAP